MLHFFALSVIFQPERKVVGSKVWNSKGVGATDVLRNLEERDSTNRIFQQVFSDILAPEDVFFQVVL